jgi:predicted O-methyltransferase YrrM
MTVDVYNPQVGQVPAELARVTQLYVERAPRRVLEIGVLYGGTLQVWLREAAPHATVVAVDVYHPVQERYDDWLRADTQLVVGIGSSHGDAAPLIRDCAPYDWVYIDGDHSASAVEADVLLALQVVRPGGLLLLHDITTDGRYPPTAPKEAYDALALAGNQTWEIIEPVPTGFPMECAHGYGVVQL